MRSQFIKFNLKFVHNSLCAVGGTINEDDHMFGLTCAKKYGGVYVPPHQAVIHQFVSTYGTGNFSRPEARAVWIIPKK